MIYDEFNRPQRNFKTGRFLPGFTPHNKGKKWSDYLSPEKAERCLKGLEKRQHQGNPNIGGWNKRKVAYIDPDGIPHIFESSQAAAKRFGIPGSNIRKVCRGERKTAGGRRFWWADSNEWAQHAALV